MVVDLALLIDEENLRVHSVGINPRWDRVERSLHVGRPDDAFFWLRLGRGEIGRWLVDNATGVVCPVAVFGRPAGLLYQALSGHEYGFNAGRYAEAHLVSIARLARAFLSSMRGQGETWRFAQQVVRAAGGTIQPWLCVLELDRDGRPLDGSPLYDVRISL